MGKKDRPLIGITCRSPRDLPNRSEIYVTSLERAGALAVFLSPDHKFSEVFSDIQGIIIPGGLDLLPSLYGEKRLYEINPEKAERIEFEFSLLREIIRLEKPVLGICYGMQVLNVFLGGTLYQDITSQIAASLDHGGRTHGIEIGENPFLQKGSFQVNSSHHQAVKDLGRGIRPFAYAPDGVVEALYREGHIFFAGVQWHPERTDDILSQRLFKLFVGACGATDR